MEAIKCVIVGDGAVGKTCLLICFCKNIFPEQYIPTVFDNYSTNMLVGDTPVSIGLWDTAGQSDYDRVRPLSYNDTDVIIICFSVICPSSFDNVKTKWHPEIAHHCPGKPIILVGNKIDLRKDITSLQQLEVVNKKPVSTAAGKDLANQIGAHRYVECSAKTHEGVSAVFQEACKAVLFPPKKSPKRRTCDLI